MIIETSAPTRIDLAGGTLDIYPINIFEDGGITVNAAIELRSFVTIKKRTDSKVLVHSKDLNLYIEADDIKSLPLRGELDLINRTIKYYRPSTGIEVTTNNTPPRGSGLGASSSLLIALSTALNYLNDNYLSKEEVIDIGANLEAQSLRIPTGNKITMLQLTVE